ncbi:hypothetical protein QUB75_24975 [Microcoleus sp. K1-B6]|uniref:hypothetical protein n=1 Tax=Microcoleus sp. K1-B6 TaxID=2818787 RepID=UPI002FD7F0CC
MLVTKVRSQKLQVRGKKSEVRGKKTIKPDRPQKLSISSSWLLNIIFPYANFPAN